MAQAPREDRAQRLHSDHPGWWALDPQGGGPQQPGLLRWSNWNVVSKKISQDITRRT